MLQGISLILPTGPEPDELTEQNMAPVISVIPCAVSSEKRISPSNFLQIQHRMRTQQLHLVYERLPVPSRYNKHIIVWAKTLLFLTRIRIMRNRTGKNSVAGIVFLKPVTVS